MKELMAPMMSQVLPMAARRSVEDFAPECLSWHRFQAAALWAVLASAPEALDREAAERQDRFAARLERAQGPVLKLAPEQQLEQAP